MQDTVYTTVKNI